MATLKQLLDAKQTNIRAIYAAAQPRVAKPPRVLPPSWRSWHTLDTLPHPKAAQVYRITVWSDAQCRVPICQILHQSWWQSEEILGWLTTSTSYTGSRHKEVRPS